MIQSKTLNLVCRYPADTSFGETRSGFGPTLLKQMRMQPSQTTPEITQGAASTKPPKPPKKRRVKYRHFENTKNLRTFTW